MILNIIMMEGWNETDIYICKIQKIYNNWSKFDMNLNNSCINLFLLCFYTMSIIQSKDFGCLICELPLFVAFPRIILYMLYFCST